MKKFSFALVALAVALAITPSAMADTWQYTIDGSDFTSNLTFFTSSNNATQLITAVSGTFDITGNPAVTFGWTPTENANPGSNAGSLTLSSDGGFLFDNLLYTTSTGNAILDWGGFLVNVSGHELNIFSGAAGLGGPGNDYFYFADNGAFHFNDLIPDAKNPDIPATTSSSDGSETFTQTSTATTPEPGSLFLLGTGLLGLALILFRKTAKPASNLILS